jgi:hypothetical protein
MICREVREANYSEYHVFFSNILPESFLSLLAKSDSDKLIRQVHEYPLDYVPINKDLFTINIGGSLGMSQCWGTSRERGVQTIMEREVRERVQRQIRGPSENPPTLPLRNYLNPSARLDSILFTRRTAPRTPVNVPLFQETHPDCDCLR